jgi:hypothetical protein
LNYCKCIILLSVLILIAIIIAVPVFAAEINCYSGKTRIYHGWGYDMRYNDEYMIFTEYKTHHIIKVSANCVVLEPVLKWVK